MAELPVHRVSLATTATALVALAALLITAPHQVGLIVVAALLVGHHLFDRRLPKMPLLVWTMRFVLFLILILTSDIEDRGLRRLYLKTDYSNLFGYLCAVELALQYWQRRDKHPPRGEALVLSGLIFAVATNTPEHRYLQWLTPLFMGLVLLSMRDFRPRRPAVEHARTRWSVRTARLVGVACAFGIAIAVIGAIRLWGDILENKLNFTRLVNLPGDPRGIGASTEPFLGPSSDLPGSTLRVIRVEGLTGESHLRGLAFDRYRNNRWGPAYEDIDFAPITRTTLNATAPGKRYLITRWRDGLGLLYLPLNVAGVAPVSAGQTMWDPVMRSARASLRAEPEYIYEAILPARSEELASHQGPLCPPITDELRQRCLVVPPEIDPRVIELARQTVGDLADPAQRAAAIARFVEKNNAYSLKINPPDGDRISDFVLNQRPGHCQYFASAAVMMLRAVGIPARYVTGYYAHEPDGKNATVVRQRDAHAWAEAWIDGVGWITIDATPAAGLPDQAFEPVSTWRHIWEWIVDTSLAVAEWAGGLTLTAFLTGVAVLVGVIILIQWIRVLLGRRRRRALPLNTEAYAYPNADFATIAAGFEKLLRRHDIDCPPTTTWPQHLAGLGASPLNADDLRAFVALYTHVRFRQQDDREALTQLRTLLNRLDERKDRP